MARTKEVMNTMQGLRSAGNENWMPATWPVGCVNNTPIWSCTAVWGAKGISRPGVVREIEPALGHRGCVLLISGARPAASTGHRAVN